MAQSNSGFKNITKGENAGLGSQFLRNFGVNGVKPSGLNKSSPYALSFQSYIHSTGPKDFESERIVSKLMGFGTERTDSKPIDFKTERHVSKPMDFVRGLLDEDMYKSSQSNTKHDPDFVHIKLMKNNTFVTVTDFKGNKKLGASSGCVPDMKGGPKMSRYAAEATAEHVGRLSRNIGFKSVVMKVKGFTYFKKKRQAIMSFKEGFSSSRTDRNPIICIEDTTRRPHNGCRLPRKRRI
jgi:small subunit ribosomal protein S11